MKKPVILLAFANDKVDNTCYLRNLSLELDGLRKALQPAVIGASSSVNDQRATDLSVRFYKSIGQGAKLQRAWNEAVDQINGQKTQNLISCPRTTNCCRPVLFSVD